MEEKKLIPAPIDNKNVCEDFTDVFHFGDFVEHSANRVIKQAFWEDGNLWVVAYRFGFNWFHIHLVQEGRNWKASAQRVKNGILSLNDSQNIMVEILGDVEQDMKDFYRCTFWFKPEACE